MTTLATNTVELVKELYPRLKPDDAAIERYRTSLDLLPPIAVARGRILVDGYHRWQAHVREGRDTIAVDDLGDLSDAEIFNESIRRNATHGQQLSAKDKANLAGKLWQTFVHLPNAERTTEIADILAVSERSVQGWTKDARQQEKAAQQDKAWDLWLDCMDQKVIAQTVGVDEATVSRWLQDRKSADLQPPESRQHFDIWEFRNTRDYGNAEGLGTSSYFGRMAPQIVENLLWLYTEPGALVVDPFAGGGTTIDVAKAMGRRVWASDRKPSMPLLPIHTHDITTGWPKAAPKKADFILLDPPYWQQAKGRYSDDDDDLGNMALDEFMAAWDRTVKVCAEHLADDGRLAFIISPSVDGDRVIDHAFEMYRVCVDHGLTNERRIIAAYSSQQATGQQVTWARENRQLLKLYRDLVVMRP